MAFPAVIGQARDSLFRKDQAEAAYRTLEPVINEPSALSKVEKTAAFELAALALRKQKRYSQAVQLYEAIGDYYQAGYCRLLLGDLMAAQPYWSRLLEKRMNHWCLSLYGLVSMQLSTYPTLFQVRNHLESDIGHLIQAGQMLFAENIMNYGDFLAQLNMESAKFIGRALLNASDEHPELLERAELFLLKGQKILPNDPEIYYHLGQLRFALDQQDEARLMLNQCLLISPSYTPAKELLDRLAA